MRRLPLFISLFMMALWPAAGALSQTTPPPNVRVTNDPALQNEQQLWVDPDDTSVIIATWQDQSTGSPQVAIGRSTDGGHTWSSYLLPNALPDYGANTHQYNPSLAYDGTGTLFLTLNERQLNTTDSSSAIAIYNSGDKGLSWAGPVVPKADTGLRYQRNPYSAVDVTGGPYDGNIYTVWHYNTQSLFQLFIEIWFGVSTDGGATFDPPLVIAPTQFDPDCSQPPFTNPGWEDIPGVLVHPGGSVHLFWSGLVFDTAGKCRHVRALKHASSADGGLSFVPFDTLFSSSAGYRPACIVDASTSPFGGSIYVAGELAGSSGAGSNLLFVRSSDAGATWSEPIVINDVDGAHLRPWLDVNEEGIMVALFISDRVAADSYDVFAAYSFDGGATFTANHRISDVSSPLPGALLGSQISVSLTGDRVVGLWTDRRDGNHEIYGAVWNLPVMKPRLLGPDSGIYVFTDAPAFSWTTSWENDQDRYRLEIADDSAFTMITHSRLVDTNFFAFDDFLPDGEHFWRVRALNTAETDSSEFSEVHSFIVEAVPPSLVTLESPQDSRSEGPITFDWTAQVEYPPGDVLYDLHAFADPPGSGFPDTVITGLLESEYTFDTTFGDTIRWYVVASNAMGGAQLVSDTAYYVFIEGCCHGKTGDVNKDGLVNLTDITILAPSLFITFYPLPCGAAANTSGDPYCRITLTDLVKLVNHLFITFEPVAQCNDFDQSNCPPGY